MGRKNNKVRQLDGLGLDFDDMFGIDSTSSSNSKPLRPQSANAPKPKGIEVQSEESSKPEVDSQDLEQWLKQEEDLKRLQAELIQLKCYLIFA